MKVDTFVSLVMELAEEFDFEIDCAMFAIKDKVSGKRVVFQISESDDLKLKRKQKKLHKRLPKSHK